MAVNPADVQVGRCFITTGGQVRQVTEIANGTVHCQVRGGKWKGKGGYRGLTLSKPPTLARFAADVARRVPCNYDKPED